MGWDGYFEYPWLLAMRFEQLHFAWHGGSCECIRFKLARRGREAVIAFHDYTHRCIYRRGYVF